MRQLAVALALALPALAGCLGSTGPASPTGALDEEDGGVTFLEDADFNTTDKWSHTLEEGPYGIGEPEEVFVTTEEFGDRISIGVVKPTGLPDGEQVPVVADVGPYYGELEGPVTDPDDARLDNFLIENLVPHGYAVAMVSVPGTGNSGGCEDYFGPREQAGVDAAVTYLGEQDWSTGDVGLIGKSYDGSTPWEAAAQGNEHLKTIVPMAGIPSFQELHFINGTAEGRAANLNFFYWTFGVTRGSIFGPDPVEQPSPVWAERACPAVAEHLVNGATGTATGGQDPTGYWAERSFKPEVLENYDGSVFIVHGLQDWNVHPDVVTDIWNELDVKKKLWFGQWSHIYPDRPAEHEDCDLCPDPDSVRWDFAEVLLRWFDSELKGMDVDTGPTVWSEDNRGGWHASDHWPPADAEAHKLYLGEGTLSHNKTDHGAARLYTPAGQDATGPLVWTSPPFEADKRIVGHPKLHFTVTPTTPGGNLIADLYDVSPDGDRKWIGHAYMDLRYAAGGDEPQPVTPGEDLEVKMQMFPLDVVVPAGHGLELVLTQERDHVDPTSPFGVAFGALFGTPRTDPATGPVIVHWGEGYDSALIYQDDHEYQTGLPWRDAS